MNRELYADTIAETERKNADEMITKIFLDKLFAKN